MIRILGIDPGTRITGYGIIEYNENSYRAIDYGCIKPPPKMLLSERYRIIFEGIRQIIKKYSPAEMAVENIFFSKNPASAIKLGQVRGVILLAGSEAGLKIYEYSPRRIKRALIGSGAAAKVQLQGMVKHLLALSEPPEPMDVSDALATAICHAQAINNPTVERNLV